MSIYFIIILLLYCISIVSSKKNVLLCLVICILLSLFAGLRADNVASDYTVYKYLFARVDSIQAYFTEGSLFPIEYEPFFYMIPAFWNMIFFNQDTAILCCFLTYAFLSVFIHGYIYMRYSNNVFIAFWIYFSYFFFLQEMTQIRAGLAIAICYLGIELIVKRKLLRFAAVVAIATCFHYSACIFGLAYFFDTRVYERNNWIFAILLSLAFGLFISKMNFSIFDQFDSFFGLSKLAKYNNIDKEPFFGTKLFFLLITTAPFAFILNEIKSKNIYIIIIGKIYLFSLISYCLFSFVPVLSYRISDIFAAIQPIMFTYTFILLKEKIYIHITMLLFCLLCLIHLIYNIQIIKEYTINSNFL